MADPDALGDRIADLEARLDRRDDRIAALEDELDAARETMAALSDRLSAVEGELTPIEARLDAHERKLATNKARIAELQARELDKGGHLRATHVDEHSLDLAGDRLERISKADGRHYVRQSEASDPLDRDGNRTDGDLLPVQRLARMDEGARRSTIESRPERLAVALWAARTDPSIADNPWTPGGTKAREYVTAGDMKHWIRRQDPAISDAYAKKLVSRTIGCLLDLSRHRLAVTKTTQRKNGLEYTERKVVLPIDAEIPGETPTSDTQATDTPTAGES